MIQLPVGIDMAALQAQTSPDERRNFVGNAIFSGIETAYPQNAGKITGMLLDEKVVDFVKLLTDQNYFNQKVFEAAHLLNQATAMQ
jgi:hypothetical protein